MKFYKSGRKIEYQPMLPILPPTPPESPLLEPASEDEATIAAANITTLPALKKTEKKVTWALEPEVRIIEPVLEIENVDDATIVADNTTTLLSPLKTAEMAPPVPDVQELTPEPIPEFKIVEEATIVADDSTTTFSLWKPEHFDLDSRSVLSPPPSPASEAAEPLLQPEIDDDAITLDDEHTFACTVCGPDGLAAYLALMQLEEKNVVAQTVAPVPAVSNSDEAITVPAVVINNAADDMDVEPTQTVVVPLSAPVLAGSIGDAAATAPASLTSPDIEMGDGNAAEDEVMGDDDAAQPAVEQTSAPVPAGSITNGATIVKASSTSLDMEMGEALVPPIPQFGQTNNAAPPVFSSACTTNTDTVVKPRLRLHGPRKPFTSGDGPTSGPAGYQSKTVDPSTIFSQNATTYRVPTPPPKPSYYLKRKSSNELSHSLFEDENERLQVTYSDTENVDGEENDSDDSDDDRPEIEGEQNKNDDDRWSVNVHELVNREIPKGESSDFGDDDPDWNPYADNGLQPDKKGRRAFKAQLDAAIAKTREDRLALQEQEEREEQMDEREQETEQQQQNKQDQQMDENSEAADDDDDEVEEDDEDMEDPLDDLNRVEDLSDDEVYNWQPVHIPSSVHSSHDTENTHSNSAPPSESEDTGQAWKEDANQGKDTDNASDAHKGPTKQLPGLGSLTPETMNQLSIAPPRQKRKKLIAYGKSSICDGTKSTDEGKESTDEGDRAGQKFAAFKSSLDEFKMLLKGDQGAPTIGETPDTPNEPTRPINPKKRGHNDETKSREDSVMEINASTEERKVLRPKARSAARMDQDAASSGSPGGTNASRGFDDWDEDETAEDDSSRKSNKVDESNMTSPKSTNPLYDCAKSNTTTPVVMALTWIDDGVNVIHQMTTLLEAANCSAENTGKLKLWLAQRTTKQKFEDFRWHLMLIMDYGTNGKLLVWDRERFDEWESHDLLEPVKECNKKLADAVKATLGQNTTLTVMKRALDDFEELQLWAVED
jgi:hypothetical protein